jgi:ABC-type transport system substrate-binding protein
MPIAVAQSPSKLAVALPAILADRGNVSARDMRSHPIGTGPFKFVECKPNQSMPFPRRLPHTISPLEGWREMDSNFRFPDAPSGRSAEARAFSSDREFAPLARRDPGFRTSGP